MYYVLRIKILHVMYFAPVNVYVHVQNVQAKNTSHVIF